MVWLHISAVTFVKHGLNGSNRCTFVTCGRPGELTNWGRVTHICVSNLTIIGSDNGLSPGRRQAIIWTNAGILLIGPLGTNFNEILIEIHTFSFKKMHLKMSSGKWRTFCLGLNVLKAGSCFNINAVFFGVGIAILDRRNPDNKFHGANMGPTWVLSASDGPYVGPMKLAIRGIYRGISNNYVTASLHWNDSCRYINV